jgi:hypothetical protein
MVGLNIAASEVARVKFALARYGIGDDVEP